MGDIATLSQAQKIQELAQNVCDGTKAALIDQRAEELGIHPLVAHAAQDAAKSDTYIDVQEGKILQSMVSYRSFLTPGEHQPSADFVNQVLSSSCTTPISRAYVSDYSIQMTPEVLAFYQGIPFNSEGIIRCHVKGESKSAENLQYIRLGCDQFVGGYYLTEYYALAETGQLYEGGAIQGEPIGQYDLLPRGITEFVHDVYFRIWQNN